MGAPVAVPSSAGGIDRPCGLSAAGETGESLRRLVGDSWHRALPGATRTIPATGFVVIRSGALCWPSPVSRQSPNLREAGLHGRHGGVRGCFPFAGAHRQRLPTASCAASSGTLRLLVTYGSLRMSGAFAWIADDPPQRQRAMLADNAGITAAVLLRHRVRSDPGCSTTAEIELCEDIVLVRISADEARR